MRSTNHRVKFLLAVFLILWVGLFVRAGYVQLVKWKQFEAEARKQHWERLELNARRGRVFDRQNRVLTLNRSTCSIQILPQYVRNGDAGKDTLAGILADFGLGRRNAVRRELETHDRLFRFRRGVDYELADSLRRVLVRRHFRNCTLIDEENQRVYPYGEACAKVVGFVGTERGLAGVETRFDSVLRGEAGWVLLQRDAVGFVLPDPSYPRHEPVAGADIRLTLDTDVQEICYRALKSKVTETMALGGSAVVISAETGAVLALADYPSYDPARFGSYPQSRYKCRAVCDQFEPGSSFKPVIGLAAMESSKARELLNREYDVSRGFIEVSGRKISDVHNNGVLDFDGLFVKSSNPGCAMLSLEIDREEFFLVARALGFGNPVGVHLPGEGRGMIDPPAKLSRLRLANNAFGHGLTVTLLQLAAAYLCVANDGVYLSPYLVASIDARGRNLYRSGRTEVRHAVKPATARRMKEILARVVTEGTGRLAAIPGIEVCGKTGTAAKIDPAGGYSATKSRMSFVGFLPKERTRYIIAVLVDEPSTSRYAAAVACPLFREIGEGLLVLERLRERTELVETESGLELAGVGP